MKGYNTALQEPANWFVARALPGGTGFTWTLVSILGDLLSEAEARFGPRDTSWAILGVEFADIDVPHVWYPGNGRSIAIQLNRNARTFLPNAIYQLAHEVVHLLWPTGGKVGSVIEEGLATYFSEEVSARERLGMSTIDKRYVEACALVRMLLAQDPDAIRKLRAVRPAFSEITPELITETVPGVADIVAVNLCTSFY